MTYTISLAICAALALFLSFKFGNTKSLILTIAMVIGLILVFIPAEGMATAGLSIYTISCAFALLYVLIKKGFKTMEKTTSLAIIVPVLLFWSFSLLHLQGARMIAFSTILSLIGAIVMIAKISRFRAESGFLLLIIADALTILLRIVKALTA